jgi:hypothetical protein
VARTHVQPHLVVGDVEAGQALIPSFEMENQMLEPAAPDRQTPSAPAGENATAGGSLTSVGLRPPSVSLPPGAFSS